MLGSAARVTRMKKRRRQLIGSAWVVHHFVGHRRGISAWDLTFDVHDDDRLNMVYVFFLSECPFLNTKHKVLKLGNLKGSPWNCQTNPREPLWRERIPLLWLPSEQHTEAIGRYIFQDVRRCERWFVPHPQVFRYVEIFHFFDMLQSIPGERRGGSRGSRGRSRGLERCTGCWSLLFDMKLSVKGVTPKSSIFMRIFHETIQHHPAIKAYPDHGDHGNRWLVVLRRKLIGSIRIGCGLQENPMEIPSLPPVNFFCDVEKPPCVGDFHRVSPWLFHTWSVYSRLTHQKLHF